MVSSSRFNGNEVAFRLLACVEMHRNFCEGYCAEHLQGSYVWGFVIACGVVLPNDFPH